VPVNVRAQVVFASPRSDAERAQVAGACVRELNIRIPALVDSIGDQVERSYTGWPDRLYLIGSDGRVAFKSAPGPFGFNPKQLEAALRAALNGSGKPASAPSQARSALACSAAAPIRTSASGPS
jgi:type I thyroxine 5'-deiodinase